MCVKTKRHKKEWMETDHPCPRRPGWIHKIESSDTDSRTDLRNQRTFKETDSGDHETLTFAGKCYTSGDKIEATMLKDM